MREGLIPTLLGTAVTGAGLWGVQGRRNKKNMGPMIAAGVLGFGLAHIVLGGIDLVQGR